jgi:hypothetical protein
MFGRCCSHGRWDKSGGGRLAEDRDGACSAERNVPHWGHLVWTADGYTVKFREGIVEIVRTGVAEEVFEEEARLNKLLDGIRSDFRIFH